MRHSFFCVCSEQQLVDCDTSNGGCSGGWTYTAWKTLMDDDSGLQLNSDYPYTSGASGKVSNLPGDMQQ